jgi:4-alpha-glucanotransferase
VCVCVCVCLQQIGARLIQILPINDTSVRQTWRDSYPYRSLFFWFTNDFQFWM